MAKKLYEEASVQDIANAIRAKNGSTATYKIAEMADAVLAIAPLQPDVEEYPQMSTTVAAYLTAAEAAYTDANGGSVSVLDSYTGASGIKDAPLGKALTMQGGTRYQQDETTGIGGEAQQYPGRRIRDLQRSPRARPPLHRERQRRGCNRQRAREADRNSSHDEVYRLCEKLPGPRWMGM